MASYNRVILVGNITRDIKLRYLQSGTAVTDLGLAVNDKVKKGDQWVDEATYVDCTLFGKQAEVAAQYLAKGSPVLIEGRLKLETWEKEGVKQYKLKVQADKMQMLGGKGGGGSQQSAPQAQQSAPQQEYAEAAYGGDDEIPF